MTTKTIETPQSQDTPLEKPGQSSVDKKVAPKMIPEAEHLKAVSDERTISGRLKEQVRAITEERDTLKAQVTETSSAVEETRAKITELESDLESLAAGDASAADIAKIRKRLTDTEAQLRKGLKAKQDALDELTKTAQAERETYAERVARAEETIFEQDVFEIVEEFEGGNADKLKAACDKAGIKTKEAAQGLADILWSKKTKAEDNEPDLLNDSGASSGGGIDLDKLSPRELFILGEKKRKRK